MWGSRRGGCGYVEGLLERFGWRWVVQYRAVREEARGDLRKARQRMPGPVGLAYFFEIDFSLNLEELVLWKTPKTTRDCRKKGWWKRPVC